VFIVNPIGIGLNIAAAAAGVLDAVRKTGKYRLDWLKAFRDLGVQKTLLTTMLRKDSITTYNPFREGDLVRGINIGKRLKEGSYTTNEVTGATRNK
jgi:hypothetical protein